jgi:hypothetical protein
MSVLRALPLALGFLLAAVVSRAQGETVPAIFSDVFAPRQSLAIQKLEAPEIVRSPLPLSPQVRSALSERISVAVANAPIAATPTLKPIWTEEGTDAILMKRFVVIERREKKIEVESVPTYLMKVFTTGEILPQRGGRPAIRWSLSEAQSTGYGSGTSTPRIALFLNWSF